MLLPLKAACQEKGFGFDCLNESDEWKLAFADECTDDWTKKWFWDGLLATVENTQEGMHFSAGPEAKNDAHHAVLWAKESFQGDIKIEYDYTRTDSAIRYVTILYIQATGDQEGDFMADIAEWNQFREVPSMRKYFENVNLLHISYAAFGNEGDGLHYIRARRYPKPQDKGFDITRIAPSYDYKGFVKTGQRYPTIKSEDKLFFRLESTDGEELFTWDLSTVEPITEGRIGLRHMYSRSAIYKDFKVYTRQRKNEH